MKLEVMAGDDLYRTVEKALDEAKANRTTVTFEFNDVIHEVRASDTFGMAKTRVEGRVTASTGQQFTLLSPEEARAKASADLQSMMAEQEKAIDDAGVMTEAQMREYKVPTPKTVAELLTIVDAQVNRPHDYGTCVYAMAIAGQAAFDYVASKLGVTGFQHGAATIELFGRLRDMKHGFAIVDYENILYPQYWESEKRGIFEKVMQEDRSKKYFADIARKNLQEHPDAAVAGHWRMLASLWPEGQELPKED